MNRATFIVPEAIAKEPEVRIEEFCAGERVVIRVKTASDQYLPVVQEGSRVIRARNVKSSARRETAPKSGIGIGEARQDEGEAEDKTSRNPHEVSGFGRGSFRRRTSEITKAGRMNRDESTRIPESGNENHDLVTKTEQEMALGGTKLDCTSIPIAQTGMSAPTSFPQNISPLTSVLLGTVGSFQNRR